MTTFADLLRDTRQARGWTQDRLAQRIGVAKATISSWESGGRAPGIGCLQLLSTALGVPLAELTACEFPKDHRLKTCV